MIPIADIPERTFSDLDSLMGFLSLRSADEIELPMKKIQLDPDGCIKADKFAGPISMPGLKSLLGMLSIPEHFALRVCPPDMLAAIVVRLASERSEVIRVQVRNDMVTGVAPTDRLPIPHSLLVEWLYEAHLECEATLNADYLRITALHENRLEVLPGDMFSYGWEILNCENGAHGTEAWRYLKRLLCANGAVGYSRTASFVRAPASTEPVLESLAKLSDVVKTADAPEIMGGATWSANNVIDRHWARVMRHLSRQLGGEFTANALESITPSSSWYELFCDLTAHARGRPVAIRRRYEVVGGQLLDWFLREGRNPAPWQDRRCQNCNFITESPAIEELPAAVARLCEVIPRSR